MDKCKDKVSRDKTKNYHDRGESTAEINLY